VKSLQITELLSRWRGGDDSVENELVNRVYPVLRELARAQVRRHRGLTMRATELANEAYVRICRQRGVDWQNRDHFYAIAATVMRRVVVDYQRERGRQKRGGGVPFVPLESLARSETPIDPDRVDWIAVDQALNDLAAADPLTARVVELRLFSGLTVEQIAGVCGTSTATVGRQWRFGRVWLADRLDPEQASAP
jgi:RNA polymerase sigma factor (TIGR02999 family)